MATPGPSRRLQVRNAVVAALNTDARPAGVTVHKARTLPFSAKQLPAVAVYLLPETVETGPGPGVAPLARRRLTLRVEARVALGEEETDLDAVLDPITTWAVQAVLADPRLGGLAVTTTEAGTQFDAVDGEPVVGGASVDFVVDYVTAAHDPTQKA